MKILLTEPQEISESSLELLRSAGHQVVSNHDRIPDSTIGGLFIRTYTKVTSGYLDKFPAVTTIIRAGTGLDNIDLIECSKRGIEVFSSPGANSTSVAEHALSMMLMVLKNTRSHLANLKQNIWRDRTLLGHELHGKTIGLIGCGAVGQKLAKLLGPFDVQLLGYDKYVSPVAMSALSIIPTALSDLLACSDIISIHVPLTNETNNILSSREFSLMQKSAYLINVSRGEVVNESALIKALSTHQINGAAIDVVVGEPSPNPRLLALSNLILTPHIAGFTHEADASIAVEAVNNFLASSHVCA